MPHKEEEKKRKPIKALFIDAIKEEVSEITLKDGGAFKECYRLLSMPNLRPCDDINAVRIDGGIMLGSHYIYVDGEGLLKDPEHFFWWRGFPHPMAGHGIITHLNDEGDNDDLDELDIEKARKNLKFAKLKMHGFVQTIESAVIFGRPGTRIVNRAVLTERNGNRSVDDARREIAEHLGLPVEQVDWVSLDEAESLGEENEPDTEG